MVINQLLGKLRDAEMEHKFREIAYHDDENENIVYIDINDKDDVDNLVLPLCDDVSCLKATSAGCDSAQLTIEKSSIIQNKFELTTITLYNSGGEVAMCRVSESIIQAVSEACMDDKYFDECEELVNWSRE